MRESNTRLSDRLMEMKMENKKLRQISADYTRVKRVFGLEQVEALWRPTNNGNRRRKAGNSPGALLTGEDGKRSRFIQSFVIYLSLTVVGRKKSLYPLYLLGCRDFYRCFEL